MGQHFGFALWLISASVLGEDIIQKPDTPSFTVSKDVPIESVVGRFHMLVDLGDLPAGSTGMVELKLINKHQHRFSIKSVELGCRCSSASLVFDELQPNSSAK